MSAYQRFWEAADRLVDRGERPSLRSVLREAGGGSFETLTPAMQLWRARRLPGPIAPVLEVPESVKARADAVMQELWRLSHETAEARVAVERAALQHARDELHAEQEELARTADELSEELARERARASDFESQLLDERKRAGRLDAEVCAMRRLVDGALAPIVGQVQASTKQDGGGPTKRRP